MPRTIRSSAVKIAIFLALTVVGYLVFAASGQYLHSRQLERDEMRVRQEITELQHQHQELLEVRDYLASDDYVEGVARGMLGLVRPGETLVVVSSTASLSSPAAEEESEAPSATDEQRPWWERLFKP